MWSKVFYKIKYIRVQESIMVKINIGGICIEDMVCINCYQICILFFVYCYISNYIYFNIYVYICFDYICIGGGKDYFRCYVNLIECIIKF